jgi:hypothetical protein
MPAMHAKCKHIRGSPGDAETRRRGRKDSTQRHGEHRGKTLRAHVVGLNPTILRDPFFRRGLCASVVHVTLLRASACPILVSLSRRRPCGLPAGNPPSPAPGGSR